MNFDQPNEIQITATNGNPLKNIDSFVYLGSEISSTDKIYSIKIRTTKAWAALDKMKVIWKSTLPENLKRNFFQLLSNLFFYTDQQPGH